MRHPLLALVPILLFAAACRSLAPVVEPPRVVIGGAAAAVASPGAIDDAIDSARVVLVGEAHDQRPHHDFQRDVLARMASREGPLLLGMEMFQRPIQQHLDDYVAGTIDEVEMLRRTEYYKRWSFDHTMYAPLWRLCRERGVRIVALNPDGPINRKVGRSGIDSLTPEERAGIAKEVDLGVAEHRKRIIGVFQAGAHQMPEAALTNMYQAMTVWDETMGESAAMALEAAGPESRMLIVAGSQHVQQYTGVPARLAKRVPGLEPLVVVCKVDGRVEDEGLTPAQIGHFVVSMPAGTLGEAPKLGVGLGDATEKGLPITSVAPGGIADRAGLKAGDVVTMLGLPDGRLVQVRDLTDFKYVLSEAHFGPGTMPYVGERADGTRVEITLDLRAGPEAPQL